MPLHTKEPTQASTETQTPEEAARNERYIKITALIVIAIGVALVLNVLGTRVIAPMNNYKAGVSSMQGGDYASAMEAFSAAGEYKDARDLYVECRQLYADQLAGKKDAVTRLSSAAPWFSFAEDGALSFKRDKYEESPMAEADAGTFVVPDVLDDRLVTSLSEKLFLNADTLERIVLPDSVTVLPDSCFQNCTAMEEVVFSPRLTTVTQRAFLNCTALKTVILPDTLVSVGLRAFNSCYSLERVVIGGSVSVLEPYTFSDCVALTEVTLPASVSHISENAFINCEALKTVYFGGSSSDWEQVVIEEGNEALANAEIRFAK